MRRRGGKGGWKGWSSFFFVFVFVCGWCCLFVVVVCGCLLFIVYWLLFVVLFWKIEFFEK